MIRNLVAIGQRTGGSDMLFPDALELYLLFKPDDFESRLLLVRVNLQLNINQKEVSNWMFIEHKQGMG